MVKYSDLDAELQSIIECSDFFVAVTYNYIIFKVIVTKVFMYINWSWLYCNQMSMTT